MTQKVGSYTRRNKLKTAIKIVSMNNAKERTNGGDFYLICRQIKKADNAAFFKISELYLNG